MNRMFKGNRMGAAAALLLCSCAAGSASAELPLERVRRPEGFAISLFARVPNGVAVRDGALYAPEISRVIRFDAIEDKLPTPPQPVVVSAEFPSDRHHGWTFICFGPDGLLYVPVGPPCNVCVRDDPRYASIMRMKPDGTGLEVFASGVRNTAGFDWHPATETLR